MQRIAEQGGVLFVNDSKATTVAATQAALAGIDRPAVLIAGGDGKGQSFVPLAPAVDRACRHVLLVGRDAALVARGLAGAAVPVEDVATLDRAVARAFEVVRPGDVVLLSPACASLDQFGSFGERGERFAALVRERLEEGSPCASA
jgi:UDP-N-acetylmuramoylalanine--D-glutamate ligase